MTDSKQAVASQRVEVIALQRGHDGVMVREPGDTFHVPAARLKDGTTWFTPLKEYKPPAVVKPTQTRYPGTGPKPGSALDDEGKPITPQPPGAGPLPGTAEQAGAHPDTLAGVGQAVANGDQPIA